MRVPTLTEQVTVLIRDSILNGELKDGDRIIETEIASKMGISRSPIREALRQLASDGLVTLVPRHGAIVTALSPEDIDEVYLIRTKLEGLAARLAAEKIADREIQMLRNLVSDMKSAMASDRIDQAGKLNEEFHTAITAIAGKPRLAKLIGSLKDSTAFLRNRTLAVRGRVSTAFQEHERIFDALAKHNADDAEKYMVEHLENSRNVLHCYLSEASR